MTSLLLLKSCQRTESLCLPGLLLLDYTWLLSYLLMSPLWGLQLCRGLAVSWLTSRRLWWICSRAACDSLHVSGTEHGQVGDQMHADRKFVAAAACFNWNSLARLPACTLSLRRFISESGTRGENSQVPAVLKDRNESQLFRGTRGAWK